MANSVTDRLNQRGAIDDNWEQTQRLWERLKTTGKCPAGDKEDINDYREPQGVWFSLSEELGKVYVHDGWNIIGEWYSEANFFVLCMEYHKRPFFKTPSLSVAFQQSVNLMQATEGERAKFIPPGERWMRAP